MTPDELKEWDDALLNLVNKGLVEIVEMENGEKGFILAGHPVKDNVFPNGGLGTFVECYPT